MAKGDLVGEDGLARPRLALDDIGRAGDEATRQNLVEPADAAAQALNLMHRGRNSHCSFCRFYSLARGGQERTRVILRSDRVAAPPGCRTRVAVAPQFGDGQTVRYRLNLLPVPTNRLCFGKFGCDI